MQVIKILRNLGLILLTAIVLWLGIAMLVYSPLYVYRTVFWQGSDSFDWQKFPITSQKRPIRAWKRSSKR